MSLDYLQQLLKNLNTNLVILNQSDMGSVQVKEPPEEELQQLKVLWDMSGNQSSHLEI